MVKRNTQWWINNTQLLLNKAKEDLAQAKDNEESAIRVREIAEHKCDVLVILLEECKGKNTTNPD